MKEGLLGEGQFGHFYFTNRTGTPKHVKWRPIEKPHAWDLDTEPVQDNETSIGAPPNNTVQGPVKGFEVYVSDDGAAQSWTKYVCEFPDVGKNEIRFVDGPYFRSGDYTDGTVGAPQDGTTPP